MISNQDSERNWCVTSSKSKKGSDRINQIMRYLSNPRVFSSMKSINQYSAAPYANPLPRSPLVKFPFVVFYFYLFLDIFLKD